MGKQREHDELERQERLRLQCEQIEQLRKQRVHEELEKQERQRQQRGQEEARRQALVRQQAEEERFEAKMQRAMQLSIFMQEEKAAHPEAEPSAPPISLDLNPMPPPYAPQVQPDLPMGGGSPLPRTPVDDPFLEAALAQSAVDARQSAQRAGAN